MKKTFALIITAVMLLSIFIVPVSAADRSIKVRINGKTLSSSTHARLIDNTTYVPIYNFCSMLGTTGKSFDDRTKTATLTCRGISISASKGDGYIVANGRYIFTGLENKIIDSVMFVPIRSIARAFEEEVTWNGNDYSVDVKDNGKTISSGAKYYDPDCVLWLARIIYAESNTEPFEGKIAVGNVVLNRVASNEYPNTIYGVIFDRKYGTQFTPVANGTIYNDPSEKCVVAAKICLEGFTYSNEIIYFMDAAQASNFWIARNRPLVFTIGNHSFYK